MTDRSVTNI